MTIGKLKRSAPILVLLIFMLLPMTGCDVEQELPDFMPLLSETECETETESFSESVPFAGAFRIIVARDGSVSLYRSAISLRDALSEQTGLEWSIAYDDSAAITNPNVFELILGYSNHPDCQVWMEDFREHDYICASGTQSAIIGGLTESATERALEYFLRELLPLASEQKLMEQGTAILYRGDYEKALVSWNGIPVYQWCITYASSQEEAVRPYALLLQEMICDRSGYLPEVVRVDQATGLKREWKLSISETAEENKAYPMLTETGMELIGGTGWGLSTALDFLIEMLFEDSDQDGICQNFLATNQTIAVERTEFRLGAVISVPSLTWSNPTEISTVTNSILAENADALFISEMNQEALAYLLQNLSPYDWTTTVGEKSASTFGSANESASSVVWKETSADIRSVYQIGGKKGGFLWVTAKEGAVLPEQLYESGLPMLVTVWGEENGMLSEGDQNRLDVIATEQITVFGGAMTCYCYATPDAFTLQADSWSKTVGYWDLFVKRKY